MFKANKKRHRYVEVHETLNKAEQQTHRLSIFVKKDIKAIVLTNFFLIFFEFNIFSIFITLLDIK